MHDAACQAGKNTHMLIARGMFVQRQHDDELCFFISPRDGSFQACNANGGLLNVLRFAVRNGEVTPRCISLDNDWNSKEEVMKGMTDNLLLAGRCRYPRKLESDLWAREAVFSTGLGFRGFQACNADGGLLNVL